MAQLGVHLMPLAIHLKMVEMVTFMSCMFIYKYISKYILAYFKYI